MQFPNVRMTPAAPAAKRPVCAPRAVARLTCTVVFCFFLLLTPFVPPGLRSLTGGGRVEPAAPPPALQARFAQIYRRLRPGTEAPPPEYMLGMALAFPGMPEREVWYADFQPTVSLGVRVALDRRTGELVAFSQDAPGAVTSGEVERSGGLRNRNEALRAGRRYVAAVIKERTATARLAVVAVSKGSARPPDAWHLKTYRANGHRLDISLDAATGVLLNLQRAIAPISSSARPVIHPIAAD